MSSDKNDERKIEEAKEKLGCKIEPPQGEVDFASEKVRLTQMTTAGG